MAALGRWAGVLLGCWPTPPTAPICNLISCKKDPVRAVTARTNCHGRLLGNNSGLLMCSDMSNKCRHGLLLNIPVLPFKTLSQNKLIYFFFFLSFGVKASSLDLFRCRSPTFHQSFRQPFSCYFAPDNLVVSYCSCGFNVIYSPSLVPNPEDEVSHLKSLVKTLIKLTKTDKNRLDFKLIFN